MRRLVGLPDERDENRMGRDHRIAHWDPEDAAAWDAGNNRIARRNLLCTLAGAVYGLSADDKLLLGAVAILTESQLTAEPARV
jgi:hypothetical protein